MFKVYATEWPLLRTYLSEVVEIEILIEVKVGNQSRCLLEMMLRGKKK